MNANVQQDALTDVWDDLQVAVERLNQERIHNKGGPGGREAIEYKLRRLKDARQDIIDRVIQLATKCSACGYTVRVEDHSPNCTRAR